VEDPGFGKYTSGSQALDTMLLNNPKYLSVWAASNDRNDVFTNASGTNQYVTFFSNDPGGIGWVGSGWYLVPTAGNPATTAPGQDGNAGGGYDSLPGQQVSKNNLVVGSIADITTDPYSNANIFNSSFSSYGPTDDGRIKPDVMANGEGLTSSTSGSNNAYGVSSGTSMASPNAAGTAALLLEHYRNLNGGATPNAATQKGLLIHTAFDAGNTGPDYSTGWGVVDGAKAANFITDADSATPNSFIVEDTYNAAPDTFQVISDGTTPLKVTLVWNDLAATNLTSSTSLDNALSMLVRDLDLLVTGPGGTFFPWTLNPASPATAAVRTTSNHLDNVEQVLIDAPAAGLYTIQISGGAWFLDYSLLYEGVVNVPEPATVVLGAIGCLGLIVAERRARRRRRAA
jgi:hypothetical protein